MPSRPRGSLSLQLRDPPGPGGHNNLSNSALAGLLIIVHWPRLWAIAAKGLTLAIKPRRLVYIVVGDTLILKDIFV